MEKLVSGRQMESIYRKISNHCFYDFLLRVIMLHSVMYELRSSYRFAKAFVQIQYMRCSHVRFYIQVSSHEMVIYKIFKEIHGP